MEWSDGIGSRGRKSFLLFVKGDEILAFRSQDIPGVVVVRGTDYEKNGKWSHTTYRLILGEGVRAISGREGWETGRFAEGLGDAVKCATPDTWSEMATALGVSVPSAMRFLREWRPKAAAKLDEVEQALAELEDAAAQESEAVRVTVSFGGPSNRAIREGFWESPKSIPGYSGEIRLKDRAGSWTKDNVAVVGISGTVLSSVHSSGMHGGYYAVSVAVIPGTEVEIPPFEVGIEEEQIEDAPKHSPEPAMSGSSFGDNPFAAAFRNAGLV